MRWTLWTTTGAKKSKYPLDHFPGRLLLSHRSTEAAMQPKPLQFIEVPDLSDYRSVWEAILKAPKDGTECFLCNSIAQLTKKARRNLIRAMWMRAERQQVPYKLHFRRKSGLTFYWNTDTYDTSMDEDFRRIFDENAKHGVYPPVRRYPRR